MILSARCGACAYEESDLRLGTSHAAMVEHDVEVRELFAAPCCARVQSVAILLGMPLPTPPCPACAEPLLLATLTRYRIARLSGDVLDGHTCPACGAAGLTFAQAGEFR